MNRWFYRLRLRLLPFGPDGIGGYPGIGREYDKAACDCLADENFVEGIFVIIRKTGKLQHRCFVKRQRVDVVAKTPLFDKFVGQFRQRQLAELIFDDDLPCGSDAQKDFVVWIGEYPTGRIGQVRAVRYNPEERTSVEQNVQDFSPRNCSSISSGRSSKNERGILKSFFARPTGRGLCRWAARARSSATGWFRRQSTTVSPCSTSSR